MSLNTLALTSAQRAILHAVCDELDIDEFAAYICFLDYTTVRIDGDLSLIEATALAEAMKRFVEAIDGD